MLIKSAVTSESYQNIDRTSHRKSTKRYIVRYGLIGFNVMLLLGVVSFVIFGQRTTEIRPTVSSSASLSSVASADTLAHTSGLNPLDQVSSADIAYNVASMSALSETTKVSEQAVSVGLEMTASPATSNVVSKPQVVGTALKSKKDIRTYVTVAGDTVASIAAQFNVTSDSVRWSNNLASNTVAAGQTLNIPPSGMSGIVYVVQAGDTPDTLAAKYKANRDEITSANDAELAALKVGERIIIPGGSIAAPVAAARSVSGGLAFGSSPVYGSNAYAYGYCTWYVANRISVPSNWGNANTWDNGAAISGWTVSSVPRAGAIGQTDRGSEGHVAVVEEVSADGTMIKYSDMNGLAGWGREGHSWTVGPWVSAGGWAPVSKFEHYIYR